MADIQIQNAGSIAIVRPLTNCARQWIEDNVSRKGYQPYWPVLVVEARYLGDLLEGMLGDGLKLGG